VELILMTTANILHPVHATVGAGGFSLDKFPRIVVRTIVTSLL
jgi:hypothetical protein